MIEWLFLLLPVAAASGWWLARRGVDRPRRSGCAAPDPAYFRGLNYLLDEQPDKAIDVFIQLAEVDRETVETPLALGSLFRRRGEVERAIRIHQSLVARTDLDREQRAHALYELGQDYMRAGLLDRAERLFGELVELRLHRRRALEALRDIYQQEKDWSRCLEVAEELRSLTGVALDNEIAHYHCELAEEALRTGDAAGAGAHLQAAEAADDRCVRATMLLARIVLARGEADAAVGLYERAAGQGPEFLPEILPDLLTAYQAAGRDDLRGPLGRLYEIQPSPSLVLALADAIERHEGEDAAVAFLTRHLSGHADLDCLERLIEFGQRRPGQDAGARAAYQAVLGVVRHLRERQSEYQCEHCGFSARHLHWQCPSCKQWGRIKPVSAHPLPRATVCPPGPKMA
ncbi:MAG: lipopolysaccharide assembly protein LapB [Chromatiaceae bacterium]|nr:lipopolysaccharide assembly protein LapB [Chromatiaceae bacterium]